MNIIPRLLTPNYRVTLKRSQELLVAHYVREMNGELSAIATLRANPDSEHKPFFEESIRGFLGFLRGYRAGMGKDPLVDLSEFDGRHEDLRNSYEVFFGKTA